jgi:carbon monoxide dehydrogenase subunit G
MNVTLAIERSIEIPAPYARVQAALRDLEATIRRFPKLKRLKKLGERDYLWEMQTIGSRLARIAHDVSYGARYEVDPEHGVVSWTPIPEQGNATIEGTISLKDLGRATRMAFRVKGLLRDVPVPLLYRVVAPAFIQGKFTRLVDVFLENTSAAMASDKDARRAA